MGLQDLLYLGNLGAKRDWGYAPDYVEAMWMMVQQDEPGDYVVATNESHSVEDFCRVTFELLDLDWKDFVRFDERYERPSEVDLLRGDPAKAKKTLNWEPRVRFQELVKIMVEADLALAKRELVYRQAVESG